MGECLMFGMDCEARSMTAVTGDEENISFLVGTNTIKEENHVNKLFVDAEGSRLMSKSFRHPAGEIRAIASHPTMANIVATCAADYSTLSGSFALCVWNIEEDKRTLESVYELKLDAPMHVLEWEVNRSRGVGVGGSSVHIFDITSQSASVQQTIEEDGEVFSGRWSPHFEGNTLGITIGRNAVVMDTRTAKDGQRIVNAHTHRTLSLDFNPNLQHVIATGGDDGFVRIWDMRNTKEAVMSIHPHAHWVWQVRYHPVHDQLLLSVGSDACVVLSCAQSVSSEQNGGLLDEEEEEEAAVETLQDGQLERIDEHEDSVYACAWSAADPWTFASLSYDGRLILSKVSRKHKYALMQL